MEIASIRACFFVMAKHIKLFIPGPIEVRKEILDAQTKWMIGHRGKPFEELYAGIQTKIRPVFQTTSRVFISTSSGTGLWEAAARNCVPDDGTVLATVCGAFSERWADVFSRCGKPTVTLTVQEGKPITPELLELEISKAARPFDAIAIVHNETSCGVINPLAELVAVIKRLTPNTLILVDAVSSLGGVDINFDGLGLDVLLTSSQKCFGLPPGLSFAAVSDRALERARSIKNRGYYFDFVEMEAFGKKNNTPSTPAISLLHALDVQLDAMHAEGLANRYARHKRLATMTREWVHESNLEVFAEQGFQSPTVTCVRNTRKLDVSALNRYLETKGMVISDGYGKLKDTTFRIAHMADTSEADLQELLTHLNDFVACSAPL